MGFASSPATRQALAPYGIRVQGARWRWAPGLKGGTFPPHRHINGQVRSSEYDFEALPGEDVNGDTCACAVVPVYRTPDGRLAKPGLTPIFQPPVTAALPPIEFPDFDLMPLVAAINDQRVTANVVIPDGAIQISVNVPSPNVRVEAPTVNVETPTIRVDAPTVNVEPSIVNVAAPNVSVEPTINVKPAPVKVIRERIAKRTVRFRRNANGQVDSAEVTE